MDVELRQRPMAKYDFKEGALLLIDKPLDWTSFDVVNKIRYQLKRKLNIKKIKVGHSGTLDPKATGLLVICTGKFTKRLTNLQGLTKTYTGTIGLGVTTPSYDVETEVDERFPVDHITPDMLEETRKSFLGELQQLPPIFSAVKVDGQPLYKRARKGQTVEIKPRSVRIDEFEITHVQMPEVGFKVSCSKGTYIRSLAYDFGKACNSGGYLTSLQRTRVGEFSLEDAWSLDDFLQYVDENY